jgi:hypothetical protein
MLISYGLFTSTNQQEILIIFKLIILTHSSN